MELITDRLILKPVSLKDKDEIFTSFNAAVTKYMFPKPADDISETIEFIKSSIKKYEDKQEIVFVDSNSIIDGCDTGEDWADREDIN